MRNKIPQIISAQGEHPQTTILTKQAYFNALIQKLQEEVDEYKTSHSLEELVDILEVIHALATYAQTPFHQLESLRQQKARARGDFSKQIFLKS